MYCCKTHTHMPWAQLGLISTIFISSHTGSCEEVRQISLIISCCRIPCAVMQLLDFRETMNAASGLTFCHILHTARLAFNVPKKVDLSVFSVGIAVP